jgi:hypothetical protein
LPDLVVAPAASNLTACHGEGLSLNWTVENQAMVAAVGGRTDRIWLSHDLQLEPSADYLLDSWTTATQSIDPGSGEGVTHVVTIPQDLMLAPGTYHIFVEADATQTTSESEEDNNWSLIGQLQLTLPPLPDLRIGSISAPHVVEPGRETVLEWTVVNVGSLDASGTWQTLIYLSDDPAIGDDLLLAAVASNGTISAGDPAGLMQSGTIQLPQVGVSGSYWLILELVTNDAGWIFESDTGNNQAIGGQSISVPVVLDLELEPPDEPVESTIVPGEIFVQDDAPPALSIVVSEDSTTGIRAIVTRSGDRSQPLEVFLTSSDALELAVPDSVIIPAGHSAVAFYVYPLNDEVVDLDATVTVTASANDTINAAALVVVKNVQLPSLQVVADKTQIREGEGVAVLTISRDFVTDTAVTVQLLVSYGAQVVMPQTAIIAPNEEAVTVEVHPVDDSYPEPTRRIRLVALADGFHPDETTIQLLDDDVPQVTLSLERYVVSEGDGAQAVVGTVRFDQPASVDLQVHIASSDETEAVISCAPIIVAGQMSAMFYGGVVDDAFVDGVQTITIGATLAFPITQVELDPPEGKPSVTLAVLDNVGPSL